MEKITKIVATILSFLKWLIGTAVPMYLILLLVCFIALPKSTVNEFFSDNSAETKPISASIQRMIESSKGSPETLSEKSNKNKGKSDKGKQGEDEIPEVVKISLEASKDKLDAMKDSYDRLFSLIAALGALFAFLGFKGYESFAGAKETADKIIRDAEFSHNKFTDFLQNKYPLDNSAEVNVVHGIVLREIAHAYKAQLAIISPGSDPLKDAEYRRYLDNSLYYLESVLENPERLDKKVVERALVSKGNVYVRLGRLTDALSACEKVLSKFDPDAEDALFNAACYSSLLGAQAEMNGAPHEAKVYRKKTLGYLGRVLKAHPELISNANEDADLGWLRDKKDPDYLALMQPIMPTP